jgi:hypothetical protein
MSQIARQVEDSTKQKAGESINDGFARLTASR